MKAARRLVIRKVRVTVKMARGLAYLHGSAGGGYTEEKQVHAVLTGQSPRLP